MEIRVPLHYSARGVRTGKKISSSLWFLEQITVDIPATDDLSAPVAAMWNDTAPPDLTYPRTWGPAHGAGEHVRVHDEDYWRPLRRYELAPRPQDQGNRNADWERRQSDYLASIDITPVDIGELERQVSGGAFYRQPLAPDLQAARERAASDYFETVEFSTREVAMQAITEAACRLLFVDGQVYVRCHEPCVMVRKSSYSVRGNGRPLSTVYVDTVKISTQLAEEDGASEAELFPLQRFGDALAQARRGNGWNRVNRDAVNGANASRQPQLFSDYFLDPRNAAMSEAAAYMRKFILLLEGQRDLTLPLGDTVRLRMYCDLAEAVGRLPSEDAMARIEETAGRWLGRHGNGFLHLRGAHEALRRALAAASERPVDVLESGYMHTLG